MPRTDRSHQSCYLSDGSPITLGARLAFGGEGSVYALQNDDRQVAKLYHEPPDAEKCEKLQAMIAHCDVDLDSFTAWPKQTLHEMDGGPCIGFVMTSAVGYKEAHRLYSPRDRKAEFDYADWRFLVRAASNIARAFASVHAAGQVLGDVNHSSVMIGPDATCLLIDCDSYQIAIDGRLFPCRVGEPLHSAPEIFGLSMSSKERTPNHDNFGLAVLVFELLFMGKHPFAGAFLGQGQPTLEEKIRDFRFAYSQNGKEHEVAPPSDSLSLTDLPVDLAAMFEQAFSRAGADPNGRPTARDWAKGLDNLFGSLTTCATDPAHAYFQGAPNCPWCIIERATGATLFNLGPAHGPIHSATLDLDAAWKAIEAIAPPPDIRALPSPIAASPTEPVRSTLKKRRIVWLLALFGAFAGAEAVAILAERNASGWGALVLLTAISVYLLNRQRTAQVREAGFRLMALEGQLHTLMTRWDAETQTVRFTNVFNDLKSKRQELLSMAHTRAQKLSELEKTLEPRLRQRHLESHRIAQHSIEGVNLSRCIALSSHGVESAADISEKSLTGIPTIGPTLQKTLLKWRREIERQYSFDPTSGIPAEEIEQLDREQHQRRQLIEDDLAAGAANLSLIKSQILTAREEQIKPLLEAMQAAEQAKTNRNAIAGL